MNAKTWADWAAWTGAATGIASLCWNIYLKVSAGPKLRVTACARIVKYPSPPDSPHYLKITVQNTGSVPTTITNVALFQYDSLWCRLRNRTSWQAVLNYYEGPQIPQKLEVGGELMLLMPQNEEIDELLSSDKMWIAVFHSFSDKPSRVKIVVPAPVNRNSNELTSASAHVQ